jgi:hypothetical protein
VTLNHADRASRRASGALRVDRRCLGENRFGGQSSNLSIDRSLWTGLAGGTGRARRSSRARRNLRTKLACRASRALRTALAWGTSRTLWTTRAGGAGRANRSRGTLLAALSRRSWRAALADGSAHAKRSRFALRAGWTGRTRRIAFPCRTSRSRRSARTGRGRNLVDLANGLRRRILQGRHFVDRHVEAILEINRCRDQRAEGAPLNEIAGPSVIHVPASASRSRLMGRSFQVFKLNELLPARRPASRSASRPCRTAPSPLRGRCRRRQNRAAGPSSCGPCHSSYRA